MFMYLHLSMLCTFGKTVTQLHARVNFETVQSILMLMHADLWDYFIYPDLHSCIPNHNIEIVMLKLVKVRLSNYLHMITMLIADIRTAPESCIHP